MDFVTKTLLAMKMAAILLLGGFLQVSARSTAQNVTYTARAVSITKVFSVIKEQTGYLFFYSPDELKDSRPVTCDWKDLSLTAVLENLFAGQPLSYEIQGNTVVVSKINKPPLAAVLPPQQNNDIHGRVTDSLGNPLAGASVTVKGSNKGTLTNEKGVFELKNVSIGSTLVVSYAGYRKRDITINDSSLQTIILIITDNQLDKAQIIAYGTTTQRLNVGDVSTVSSREIEEQPVIDPVLALEGRVPGLYISQNTGFAGSGLSIQILGQNSINNGSNPLYVIDGVPYISTLLPLQNTVQGGQQANPSPFSYLNPSDIESISVLKDADATSIYGSRAANGAILITTKKAKPGRTAVDFNLQNGIGQVARKLPLLNTQQYLQVREKALSNDGLTPGPTDYDINGLYDSTRYTDWQKVLIGRNSEYTTIESSVSGGTLNTQFLVSGTFHRETTVFPGNLSDQKGSVHFNMNNVSINQRFKIQLNGNYQFDENRLPDAGDPTLNAMNLAPDAPAIYNKDGTLNWAPDSNGNSTWTNPLAYLYNTSLLKNNNLISNLVLNYSVLPGLELKANFGYTYLQSREVLADQLLSFPPEDRAYPVSSLSISDNNVNSWIIEPQAQYSTILGKSKLIVVTGSTLEQINSNGQQISSSGFSSDLLINDLAAASSVYAGLISSSIYKYNALFGRLTYNWDEKYLINLTARRDGSSRFGPANEFHNFGSVAGGWIFSKEDFISKGLPILSFGKLSASYGTTGNDQIGDYQYLSTYNSIGVSMPYQGATGLQPNGLSNPYLQWEETRKARIGLDVGFLKDRIVLTGGYFLTRSSNQLLGYRLPYLTGFNSITENFPATLQNSGWEIALNTVNFTSKTFSWRTSFNLTIPKNKLVSFSDLDSTSYANEYIIGQPISIVRTDHLAGVNPSTGVYEFTSAHGQLTSTPNNPMDAIALVNVNPRFYGGFQNSFRFKGFQLDVFFQFVKHIINNSFMKQGQFPGTFSGSEDAGNQPTTVLKAWQNQGDVSSIQRYNSNFSLISQIFNARTSDGAFSDASFVRLKNLSLSWSFPDTWKKSMNVQDVRAFLQCQNLLTITKFTGLDPESGVSTQLPPLRIVTAGIHVTL